MAGSGEHDPHRAELVVRAVPDPARTGDFVLPLLELMSADHSGRQLGTQSVLALADPPRVVR